MTLVRFHHLPKQGQRKQEQRNLDKATHYVKTRIGKDNRVPHAITRFFFFRAIIKAIIIIFSLSSFHYHHLQTCDETDKKNFCLELPPKYILADGLSHWHWKFCDITTLYVYTTTGWRRLIRCLKLQVIFRKRATNYRALLRTKTYKDKASYRSSPPCT